MSSGLYDEGMEKDFDGWNRRKKRINEREMTPQFHDGEIWWYAAGINVGSEIDGKHGNYERPVFILKKCNRTMFIGIPCTSISGKGEFIYDLRTNDPDFTLNFSQVKTVSSRRLLRKVTNIRDYYANDIFLKFVEYLKRKSAR